MKKGISFSIVFKANSLNYGEGIGNMSELKKFHRGDNQVYTFASRQSLRYDIVRLGNEFFDWNLDVLDKKQGTVQFTPEATIQDSVEMDLFGYMKTLSGNKSKVRTATVKISHAMSLEPYLNDLEFLNNMGFAHRINEDSNLAMIEQHLSLYTYTVTIDLDKVGIDNNDDIELESAEKNERITQLLEIIKVLSRGIRGRQENLAPLLVIGGMYDIPNPYFQNRIQLKGDGHLELDLAPLNATLESTFMGNAIKEDTLVGYLEGSFSNNEEIHSTLANNLVSVEEFFTQLQEKVTQHYGA